MDLLSTEPITIALRTLANGALRQRAARNKAKYELSQ